MGSLILRIGLNSNRLQDRVTKPMTIKIQKDVFKAKNQIVQSEDSLSRKKMDDAFLSDKNRFFERETRARKNDFFHPGTKGEGYSKSNKKEIDFSDLAIDSEDPFKKAAKDYSKDKAGVASKQSGKVSSTNDFLEDIPLGDITQLNSTEYKFYGFYHRIRQKLEQFWGRTLYEKAEQMINAGRRIPGSEEMITALRIILDDKGEIIAIKILGSSGIKELDDAAIESFNEAGPFPNPPKDLVVNGKVILEWGFVVKS